MLALACAVVAGAAVRPATAATTVVATIFPVADIVRQLGGANVAVHTLLPGGANPHTFEPTPQQLHVLAGAQLIVRVGAGLDDWLFNLLQSAGSRARVVKITDGLDLLGPADSSHGDPHVWLDPILVRDHVAPALARALGDVDARNRATYEKRAAEFAAELTRLDGEIGSALRAVPRRGFVAVHPAWRYFARRYGLEEVAVIEESPGKEPSAQSIARIVERARAGHVRAVLTEPQFTERTAAVIAGEIGAAVVVVDPIGGAQVSGRDSYLALMRYNLAAFLKALS